MLYCDNMTVVHQLLRGRTANHLANKILADLASFLQATRSQVSPNWVSTTNQLADPHTRELLQASPDVQSFGAFATVFSRDISNIPNNSNITYTDHNSLYELLSVPLSSSTSADVPLGILPTGV
jgi:hypothetical protein